MTAACFFHSLKLPPLAINCWSDSLTASALAAGNDREALAREQGELNKTLTSMIKLMGWWFMLFESFNGD